MKKLFYFLIIPVFMACGGSSDEGQMKRDERLKSIKELEEIAFSDVDRFDTSTAYALVRNYGMFASENPTDELTPNYLFKAADLSMALNRSELAIDYFDRIIADYPDYSKAPYSMFLRAFVYDEQLHNMEKAKAGYEDFIKKYPDHEMADAARFSLKNLGKSPEELIREFEENQADTTQAQI